MKNTWIYFTDSKNKYRYALGEQGEQMLGIIGINPSTAKPGLPDRTINRVRNYVELWGFNGWCMFNLWPQITPYPTALNKRFLKAPHNKNLEIIEQLIGRYQFTGFWAAWGNHADSRPWFYPCLNDISKLVSHQGVSWYRGGDLTQKGHPRHPLYCPSAMQLKPFDMDTYLDVHRSHTIAKKDNSG